jgi:uncharacterized protein YbjT (DUF2867 family)
MAMMKSSLSSPILVTGATGTVGRAVLHALAARGVRATAAVRDPARVPVESASAVRFDYSDPSTFGPALAGQDRVFLIGPPLLASMDELLRPFIEHLASDVPRRVVYLSAYGMDALTELPIHAVNERRLRAAKGLELTVLRPGFFTQNFATYSRADIEERGTLFLPVGKGCTPFVDVVDIARCAADASARTSDHARRADTGSVSRHLARRGRTGGDRRLLVAGLSFDRVRRGGYADR